jgi:hypothetical protein
VAVMVYLKIIIGLERRTKNMKELNNCYNNGDLKWVYTKFKYRALPMPGRRVISYRTK